MKVVSKGLNIVHVCERRLPYVGHQEAREDSLQPDKEGFQIDDEKQSSQGVPLTDGEEDGQDWRDVGEKEGG